VSPPQRHNNEKDPVWKTAIPKPKGNFVPLVASHNIHEGENLPLTELPPTLKVNTLGLLRNYQPSKKSACTNRL
jgi:hypothetical protein